MLVCFVRLLQVHYYFLGKQSNEYSRQHPWHSVELYRRGSAHSTVTTPLSAGGRLLVSWYKWVPAKTMSWVRCETAAWIILADTGVLQISFPFIIVNEKAFLICKRSFECHQLHESLITFYIVNHINGSWWAHFIFGHSFEEQRFLGGAIHKKSFCCVGNNRRLQGYFVCLSVDESSWLEESLGNLSGSRKYRGKYQLMVWWISWQTSDEGRMTDAVGGKARKWR